ncbi:TOB3 (member of AAA-ATPase family) [Fusarium fujikuroi]|nr:TOB3 (member of AAA-ATPase family) [Fusarium fujikuroi]SCO49867.1 related to TOB3 (member of AAA-ATPase family) [Fusarium fujikuroi]
MSSWGDGDDPWCVKDSGSAGGEAEAGELGHICEVRDAFAEFDKSGDFVKWLDEMPYGEEEDPVRKAKRIRDTYAIVCGRYPTRESTWEVQTIWINNPILQDVLRGIMGDHPDWSFREGTFSFQKPFVPLVHHWEQLCELVDIDAGSETQKFMKLFMDLIRGEL